MSAHHTDTDFGAEKVASNPATAGISFPWLSTRSTSALPS